MAIRNRTNPAGFTLFEILMVLAILVVLGTVSVVAYQRIQVGANKKACKLLVDQTADGVELYYAAMMTYPETDEGLAALYTVPEEEEQAAKWRDGGGPFLTEGRIPRDPWGSELKYEKVERTADSAGPEFHVWSIGPDKEDGSDDDIKSWLDTSTE